MTVPVLTSSRIFSNDMGARTMKRPEGSFGLLAPARTPPPILNQINNEIARVLNLPDIKERILSIDLAPAPSTPEEYDKILRGQIETLSKVVRDAGLRPK